MHYRISDLPDSERPRERLLKTGVKSLSLTELIAILLRTGDATTHQSALTLAQAILKKAATLHQNPLVALQTIETQHITNIAGIGPAKACCLLAGLELGKRVYQFNPLPPTAITTSENAATLLAPLIRWQAQEVAAILILNASHHVLGLTPLSNGAVTETLVCFKTLFRTVLSYPTATGFILAHGHPSTNCTPSKEDELLTEHLILASEQVQLDFLDHLVIGNPGYVSLRETSRLWNQKIEF